MTEPLDVAALRGWIGRRETRTDVVTAQLVSAYRATVSDVDAPAESNDIAPAGIHWCLAAPTAPTSALGPDGHPARGGFLPPVPLPRRMWAGSRVVFPGSLRVGDEVERHSTIKSVKAKSGRSGELLFVTVEHLYRNAVGEAVREEQDLVYRDAPAGSAPPSDRRDRARPGDAPAPEAERTRMVDASPVLLFRFSALTFNGHRIHYDRRYATEMEFYPGLVVHGPLQAALLLDLATTMSGGVPPSRFEFRAERPLFDGAPIVLNGAWRETSSLDLWVGAEGQAPNMSAAARW